MKPDWASEGVLSRRPWARERGGGCCGECGQPSGRCRCRECRKESRCLLVTDTTVKRGDGTVTAQPSLLAGLRNADASGVTSLPLGGSGTSATGFIGGDCCVSLSVECAATDPTSTCMVFVGVGDTEGAELLWFKTEPAGTSYRVYEDVITTKPGATLVALASNCTARVRWCEVFSC